MQNPSLFQIQLLTDEQRKIIKDIQIELKRIKLLQPHNEPVPHEESSLKQKYKKIPIIGGFLSELSELGKQLLDSTPVGDKAGIYTPFVGVFSLLANLFRIGILKKDAEEKGIKLKLNSYKKAKFTYTVIALSLCLLTFAFPEIAAGLFVATACLGLVASIVTLSKTHWHRYKERQEIKKIEKNQPAMEERMREIKKELAIKEDKLFHIHFGHHDAAHITTLLNNEKKAIFKLSKEYEELNETLSRKTALKAKFTRKKEKFFDKHLAVPFAIVGVIAAIIGLTNPVLGLAIATAGIITGLGSALIIFVIFPKVIKPLFNALARLFASKETTPTPITKNKSLHPTDRVAIKNQLGALTTCSIPQHQETLKQQEATSAASKNSNVVAMTPKPKPTTDETDGESEGKSDTDEEGSGDNETPKPAGI